MSQTDNLRGYAVLSVSIVLAALVFGLFFLAGRTNQSTVRAVGAATIQTGSDIGKLRMYVTVRTGTEQLHRGYEEIGKDVAALRSHLVKKGLPESEISVQPPNSMPNYNQQGIIIGYTIQQLVSLVSSNIETLEELAFRPGDLASAGIEVQSLRIEYYSSDLGTLKKELLAKAAADARERAEEMIRDSGMSISGIESARAGVFQITEPYSTEVTDYGIYDTSTRQKEITVTVAVTFLVD